MKRIQLSQELKEKILDFCENNDVEDYNKFLENIILNGLKPTPIINFDYKELVENGVNCPECGCNRFLQIEGQEAFIECIACGNTCEVINI